MLQRKLLSKTPPEVPQLVTRLAIRMATFEFKAIEGKEFDATNSDSSLTEVTIVSQPIMRH